MASLPLQQLPLFGHGAPAFDASFGAMRRIHLAHGAWLDLARGWLSGHASVFDELARTTAWRSEEREMYDRTVDVPRLYAVLPAGRRLALIERMREAFDRRYETTFERVSLAYYRDGRDSVAWHGDYVARRMPEAFVATVAVGSPRRFLLRPTGGGRSVAFSLGWGDLIVMGGTCQRTYQHAIPKVSHAGARIAIMFRPVWREEKAGGDGAEE